MAESFTVRFVPRSGSALEMSDMGLMGSEATGDLVRPAKKSLRAGLKSFADRKVVAQATPLDRLNSELTEKELKDLFGAVVLETRRSQTDSKNSIVLREEFVAPQKALSVPEALKDSIAFAYMPQPVEFHAPSFHPPFEAIYHVGLAGVGALLNTGRCHRNGWTGKGIKVAMADSGFWLHPHFIRGGHKLIPTESPGSGDPTLDDSGHGTGEAANIFAVAPDCTVYGVKHGSSAASTLEACIALDPHIMTNSWGWNKDSKTRAQLEAADPNFFFELLDVENVLRAATGKGIVVFFSAGNGHLAFPASFPNVIAVGGVTAHEDGSLTASDYASGFKSKLYPGRDVPDFCGIVGASGSPPLQGHIMLPVPESSELDGENFVSGRKRTGWGIFSGTSAASPQAAGVAALMLQISSGLQPEQIRQIIAGRAIDVAKGKSATGATAKDGRDLATGAGLMDALRACTQLAVG